MTCPCWHVKQGLTGRGLSWATPPSATAATEGVTVLRDGHFASFFQSCTTPHGPMRISSSSWWLEIRSARPAWCQRLGQKPALRASRARQRFAAHVSRLLPPSAPCSPAARGFLMMIATLYSLPRFTYKTRTLPSAASPFGRLVAGASPPRTARAVEGTRERLFTTREVLYNAF